MSTTTLELKRAELETLLCDPLHFLDEYFEPLQFAIDLYAEREKHSIKQQFHHSLDATVEDLLDEIKEFKAEALDALAAIYQEEVDEMRQLLCTGNEEQLEKAIAELKDMLLNWTHYEFNDKYFQIIKR